MFIRRLLYSPMFIGLMVLCWMGAISAAEPVQQGSIDFRVIQKFAGFANAAYQPESDIAELIKSENYVLTQYRTIPEIQISYFIASNELTKTQLIAVRGTSNVENAMVDIALKLRLDEHTGVQLHNGFAVAARQVYADLKPLLKKEYVISTTGHSLGGAVASILAMYLDKDRFSVGQVITFGQPKFTNVSGARQFQRVNLIRVVTPLDLVPLVPLFDPLDIRNIDIYWHAGKEVLLFSGNRYSILEGMNSMLRATKFTQKPLTEESLQNHKMSFYIEMLKNKKQSSQQVPFKNSFNLFNLFGS